MKKISLTMMLFGLLGFSFFTTGCALAPLAQPLLTGALIGTPVAKSMMSTKVAFVDEKMTGKDKVFLSQIKVLAVWPDNEGEVYLAEKLQERDLSVRTPSQVGRIIREQNLERKLDNLTRSERMRAFQIVCEASGADAIVAWKKSRVVIYSVSKKGIIWSARTTIAHAKNSTREEKINLIVEAAAEKFFELIFGDKKLAEAK